MDLLRPFQGSGIHGEHEQMTSIVHQRRSYGDAGHEHRDDTAAHEEHATQRRRTVNWKRRQRRKAARERSKIQCLSSRDALLRPSPGAIPDGSECSTNPQKVMTRTAFLCASAGETGHKICAIHSRGDVATRGMMPASAAPSSASVKSRTARGTEKLGRHRQTVAASIQARLDRLKALQELRSKLFTKTWSGVGISGEASQSKFMRESNAIVQRLTELLNELQSDQGVGPIRPPTDTDTLDTSRKNTSAGNIDNRRRYVKATSAWSVEEVLFGGKRRQRQRLLRSRAELEAIRREWDAFADANGQAVPVRWVVPPRDPGETWSDYLVG